MFGNLFKRDNHSLETAFSLSLLCKKYSLTFFNLYLNQNRAELAEQGFILTSHHENQAVRELSLVFLWILATTVGDNENYTNILQKLHDIYAGHYNDDSALKRLHMDYLNYSSELNFPPIEQMVMAIRYKQYSNALSNNDNSDGLSTLYRTMLSNVVPIDSFDLLAQLTFYKGIDEFIRSLRVDTKQIVEEFLVKSKLN